MQKLQFRNELEDLKVDLEEMAYDLLERENNSHGYFRAEALKEKRMPIEMNIEEIIYYLNTELTIDNIEEMECNVDNDELLTLIYKYIAEYEAEAQKVIEAA